MSLAAGQSTPQNDATTRHLLVVDDDYRIRTLSNEFLSRHGFRVTPAAHAEALNRRSSTNTATATPACTSKLAA